MTGTVLDEYQKFGVLLNLLDFRSLVVETFLALEDVSLLIRCLKKSTYQLRNWEMLGGRYDFFRRKERSKHLFFNK